MTKKKEKWPLRDYIIYNCIIKPEAYDGIVERFICQNLAKIYVMHVVDGEINKEGDEYIRKGNNNNDFKNFIIDLYNDINHKYSSIEIMNYIFSNISNEEFNIRREDIIGRLYFKYKTDESFDEVLVCLREVDFDFTNFLYDNNGLEFFDVYFEKLSNYEKHYLEKNENLPRFERISKNSKIYKPIIKYDKTENEALVSMSFVAQYSKYYINDVLIDKGPDFETNKLDIFFDGFFLKFLNDSFEDWLCGSYTANPYVYKNGKRIILEENEGFE